MDRSDALARLKQHREMFPGYGVRSLSVFGSVARDQANASSDVDVLVEFEGPATFARYMGLKYFLEDLLGCKVDLVTQKALRAELRAAIEPEVIRVA